MRSGRDRNGRKRRTYSNVERKKNKKSNKLEHACRYKRVHDNDEEIASRMFPPREHSWVRFEGGYISPLKLHHKKGVHHQE